MRIVLARHAQSEWQLDRSSTDWNSPLTRLGHEQARRLAAAVASGIELERGHRVDISCLYSSPLERARQTAQYVAEATALGATTSAQLGEAEFHVASELPGRDTPFAPGLCAPPSPRYRAFRAQAEAALRLLIESAPRRGAVLAVTHGGLIKTLLRTAASSDSICFRLYNACLTLLEWRRGRWHLVYLNLWDHLPVDLRTE